MGKGCREGVHLQIVLKTGKTLRKKQKKIRKKSNSMGKGCREDFHLHIALKTGKKPEKKTINNPEKNQIVWGRYSGKVLIYRSWFVFLLFLGFDLMFF